MKNRYILDSVLIANGVIDDMKKNRKRGFIFKVDFQKAFDCLKWEFIEETMKSLGFGPKWIKWVMACLTSASISVLVNGSLTRELKLKRGVRQGDPISPFLFIIAAEGLYILIKKAVESGFIE
ncbi:secreted RxLR effector protein 78-like [Rutidosis leptorrhynchoides]|uniref:secreted RxLR effector protein 78-like n=1 Tax=Rutidosis leptorrhynchoides TaxID=125765 RepID=UPI003A992C60